jgi:hypothetical protein
LSYVIRVIQLATGHPSEIDGTYVESYTDTDGRGRLITTAHREAAMQFEDATGAFEFWNQVSQVQPKRDDGEPNKPLTAFTVAVEQ